MGVLLIKNHVAIELGTGSFTSLALLLLAPPPQSKTKPNPSAKRISKKKHAAAAPQFLNILNQHSGHNSPGLTSPTLPCRWVVLFLLPLLWTPSDPLPGRIEADAGQRHGAHQQQGDASQRPAPARWVEDPADRVLALETRAAPFG